MASIAASDADVRHTVLLADDKELVRVAKSEVAVKEGNSVF